jgi:hypothetical protein
MNILIQDTLNQRGRFEETTTPRFNNIRTADVMNQFEGLGWKPFASSQVRSRDVERRAFAKHFVSLARVGEEKTLGEYLPRINLRNANDGSASFELFAGFYRLICTNGLMVGSNYSSIRIRHSLSADKLGEALGEAVAHTEIDIQRSASVIKEWEKIMLTPSQIGNLAGFAVGLRWREYFGGDNFTKASQRLEEAGAGVEFMREEFKSRMKALVEIRRVEDATPSLWHVFNRIQENVIRGGYNVNMPRRTSQGMDIRPRRMRTINSIAQSIEINRKLWDATEAIQRGETLPVLIS